MTVSDAFYGDLASVGSALTWSVGVIFLRRCTFEVPTLLINTFRTACGFLFFLAVCLIAGYPLVPEIPLTSWGLLFMSGVVGIFVGDVLFLQALKRLGAGLTAILAVSYAPTVIFSAWLLYGETLPLKSYLGGGLVIAAVLLSTSEKRKANLTLSDLLIGSGCAILSEIAMSSAVLSIRPILRAQPTYWILAVRFGVGTLFFLPIAMRPQMKGAWRQFFSNRPMFLQTCLATLSGTILAVAFWFAGFKYTLAGRAAIYNQLSTIFIVILAALFLKEPLTRRRAIAVILAFGGALIVGG